MSIIKGSIDERTIITDERLDISKSTYIFIQNNGEVTAYFGNRKIGAGKEIEINLGFQIANQTFEIRFDTATGTKELYIMLGKATIECN